MKEIVAAYKNFGFQYRAQAEPTLYNIDLDIHKGEKILILGPSGSGKSTLGYTMNGLIPFSYSGEYTGSLQIKGQEIKELSISKLSKIVGTVLQDADAQFVGLTVAEDIAFALENDCIPQKEMKERVQAVAEMVEIATHLKKAPQQLSGGQKQRVSLAGVMVDDVEILLFDEPLANLDPATGKKAIELIDMLQRQTNAAVIIIEHRLEDVLHAYVDRIVVMKEGRIYADDTPANILASGVIRECGIREPLYLTALRYAGQTISPDMHPEHMNSVEIDQQKIKTWYETGTYKTKELKKKLLEIQNINFVYQAGPIILDDICMDVYEGEMISIVGRNGAGKSTLSKIIGGFEKIIPLLGAPEARILLQGRDISKDTIKERAEHIGVVMQNPNHMISKTQIFDEVAFGLLTRGMPEEEIKERVYETLKICGLYPFRNWPVSALSYGQKKRVTIASILVLNPKILILDEPTAGQDFKHYTDIMEFLLELNQKGVTIILVTHDMHLMLEYTDRAVVLAHGRKIADDMPAYILADKGIVRHANLRATSLHQMAERCGIEDSGKFVQHFIETDRANRAEKLKGLVSGEEEQQ